MATHFTGPVISANGFQDSSGTAMSASALLIGSTSISEAEVGVLDAVTPGTVTGSKALVVDSNKDIATIRHLTISGNLVSGSTTISETELGFIDGVTAGTSAASKAVVLSASSKIDTIDMTALKINGTSMTATAAELNTNASVTAGTTTASKTLVVGTTKNLDTLAVNDPLTGATPVHMVDVGGTTLTAAAGASNVTAVTIQLKDGAGTNMTRAIPVMIYLSDSSAGAGITGTTASGAVAAGATGIDLVVLTSKKVISALTNTSGSYTLSITDTAKTGFYVVAAVGAQGIKVSTQLQTSDYGA